MQDRGYTQGERVYGAIDDVAGTVVSVDTERRTITIDWSDGAVSVVYNSETMMVRRGWPWES